MLGKGNLFKTTGGPEQKEDNAFHLAHMVALLGPPPADFLARTRNGRAWNWFNEDGKCSVIRLVIMLYIHARHQELGKVPPTSHTRHWETL